MIPLHRVRCGYVSQSLLPFLDFSLVVRTAQRASLFKLLSTTRDSRDTLQRCRITPGKLPKASRLLDLIEVIMGLVLLHTSPTLQRRRCSVTAMLTQLHKHTRMGAKVPPMSATSDLTVPRVDMFTSPLFTSWCQRALLLRPCKLPLHAFLR